MGEPSITQGSMTLCASDAKETKVHSQKTNAATADNISFLPNEELWPWQPDDGLWEVLKPADSVGSTHEKRQTVLDPDELPLAEIPPSCLEEEVKDAGNTNDVTNLDQDNDDEDENEIQVIEISLAKPAPSNGIGKRSHVGIIDSSTKANSRKRKRLVPNKTSNIGSVHDDIPQTTDVAGILSCAERPFDPSSPISIESSDTENKLPVLVPDVKPIRDEGRGNPYIQEDPAYQAQQEERDRALALKLARSELQGTWGVDESDDVILEVKRKGVIESTIKCPICLEDVKRDVVVSGFGNCFCEICWECASQYVQSKVKEYAWPIKCPVCQKHCTAKSCSLTLAGLGSSAYDALQTLVAEKEHVQNVKYCSNPSCGTPFAFDDNPEGGESSERWRVTCPACKKDTCVRCRAPWHPKETCEERNMTEDEKQLSQLARKRKWKKCPSCNTYVQRISGCDHMQCKCGASFCYRCGRKKSRYSSHSCACESKNVARARAMQNAYQMFQA